MSRKPEMKEYWLCPMPKNKKSFKFVLIPANLGTSMQELVMEQPEGKEPSFFIDTMKAHYRTITKTQIVAEQVELVKEALKRQGKDHKLAKLRQEALSVLGKSQKISNIPLMVRNRTGSSVGWRGFEQIDLYIDKYATLNNYPENGRAEKLLNEVGTKHGGLVWGDCFVSRFYDNGVDDFIRMDFTLDDLNKNAPWRHFAIRRNFSEKSFPCLLERSITWKQEHDEVVIKIPTQCEGLKAKKVDVRFSCEKIGVTINGEMIFDRELGGRIDPNESTWELKRDQGIELEVTLCKSGNVDWDFLLM